MSASPVVPVVSPAEIRKRAAAYVAAVPPAIQGEGGDSHTYRLAASLVVDFLLPPDEALALLRPWNATCQPPWSERDLAKKVENAARYGRHARGAKLAEGSPRRTAFHTADEVVDALIVELRAPLDPEGTARFMAELGVETTTPPDLADEIRGRQSALSFLLAEADTLLPWKRPVGRGRPNAALVPREARGAALLAAMGAYLAADGPPQGEERLTWIMEEVARQHFACQPPTRAARTEIPFRRDVLAAMARPPARDGHGHTERASSGGDGPLGSASGRVNPCAQLPEDPETIVAREETLARFRASLSPLERAIFDEPFSAPEREVGRHVGTTPKTVHSTRNRIRKKARAWGASAGADGAPGGERTMRPAWASRPWPVDEEVQRLIRPMTADEVGDLRAGYPASRYRLRREALWAARAAATVRLAEAA